MTRSYKMLKQFSLYYVHIDVNKKPLQGKTFGNKFTK